LDLGRRQHLEIERLPRLIENGGQSLGHGGSSLGDSLGGAPTSGAFPILPGVSARPLAPVPALGRTPGRAPPAHPRLAPPARRPPPAQASSPAPAQASAPLTR